MAETGKTLLDLAALGGAFVLACAVRFEGVVPLHVREGLVYTLPLTAPGAAGALMAREIAGRPDLGIRPVGFLDDDRGLRGLKINGIRVLGATGDLAEVARRTGARQALITGAAGAGVRQVVRLCEG